MPDPQLDAILAAQAADGWLVTEEPESQPEQLPEGGANETWQLHLSGQMEPVYFKPQSGVNKHRPPLRAHAPVCHPRGGRRLATGTLAREPVRRACQPCVLREIEIGRRVEIGALTLERFGDRAEDVFQHAPPSCLHAAFFDALIGNQDRRSANWKFDADQGLGLFDHGFAFPASSHDVTVATELLEWRGVQLEQPELDGKERELIAMLRDSGDLLGVALMLDLPRREAFDARVDYMAREGILWSPNSSSLDLTQGIRHPDRLSG